MRKKATPIGVKPVGVIFRCVSNQREKASKDETSNSAGTGECANTSLPCFRVYVWVLKSARKFFEYRGAGTGDTVLFRLRTKGFLA